MNILALALNRTDYNDVDRVKEKLYQIKDFPGVSGKTTFDENGDVIKPYGIYKIFNGQGILLKTM